METKSWEKKHKARQARLAEKENEMGELVKHHNEMLARFYGKPTFNSSVANKVNEELSAQLINQQIRHTV